MLRLLQLSLLLIVCMSSFAAAQIPQFQGIANLYIYVELNGEQLESMDVDKQFVERIVIERLREYSISATSIVDPSKIGDNDAVLSFTIASTLDAGISDVEVFGYSCALMFIRPMMIAYEYDMIYNGGLWFRMYVDVSTKSVLSSKVSATVIELIDVMIAEAFQE